MENPWDHATDLETAEKQIFDLRNLLEISRSLSSTLDYGILNDSILYTCLGALMVNRAAFFSKKAIDSTDFSLHRSYLGFELDHAKEYALPENGVLVRYLNANPRCYDLPDLMRSVDCPEVQLFVELEAHMVVPLQAKGMVNGILVLGGRLDGSAFGARDRQYLMDIASLAAIAIHNAYLFEMSTTDLMTKLKVKHYFLNRLQEVAKNPAEAGHTSCLIMLDIDHFKKVNDTWGHLTGDTVLKRVAQVVFDSIRRIDVAARYGGEEFILFLPETGLSAAAEVAERIRSRISGLVFESNGSSFQITASFGVARLDLDPSASPVDSIDRADKALYASKMAGRNRVSVADSAVQLPLP